MPQRSQLTPAQGIAVECARRGRDQVVAGCMRILTEGSFDDELLMALSCSAGSSVLAGRAGGREGYWPRVWAVRGLLHVWDPSATPVVVQATRDGSWRVREMAAKVVARHRVEGAFDALLPLQDDEVPRVRAAALRAIGNLATG